MLEPRMVAARTHDCDFFEHGELKLPARITASSQGCFILTLDASRMRVDSGQEIRNGRGL